MKTKHFLLCCIAVLCCISTFAHDFKVDGIYYNKLGGNSIAVTYLGISYSSYSDRYEGSVTIPATVTYNSTTYRVIAIGDNAFDGCSSLTEITIPNSVIAIGSSAFRDCSGLTSITIPEGVTSISSSAFSDCSGLTSITIPEGVTSIGDYAFDGCSSLTAITIPENLTSIGHSAFGNCSNLTSIQWNAKHCADFSQFETPFYFHNGGRVVCDIRDQITSFTFGDSVEHIPAYLCDGMSITSVTIPNSVTSIGKDAFGGCYRLSKVNISNVASWIKISFDNFYSNPMSHADKLYANGNLITTLVIPKDITEIKKYTFYSWKDITSVTIPNSIRVIGDSAFYNCRGLTALTTPNCTRIGNRAFAQCTNLHSAIISSDYVGEEAFANCSKLQSITINDGYYGNTTDGYTTEIGVCAFVGCALRSVIWNAKRSIVASYVYTGYYSDSNGTCTPFVWYFNINENFFSSTSSYSDNVAKGITSFVFGDNVEQIPAYLCCQMGNIKEISLPKKLKSIGYAAFYGCGSLSSPIIIPDGVKTIPEHAFYGCGKLSSLTIPEGVTSIGDYAFGARFDTITCYAITPPQAEYYTFGASDCIVNVPCGSGDKYKQSWGWKQLQNIQESTFFHFSTKSKNTNQGTVVIVQAPDCNNNATAIVQAKPCQGYNFLSWNDGDKNAKREITVTQDTALVAYFEESQVRSVTLSDSSLTMSIMQTVQLIATCSPADADNQNVIWTSSDSGIASVDANGFVTAKEQGTATITATTEDGGYTATCSVTVTIPVSGILLDITSLELFVGAHQQITATIQPEDATNQNIIWTSGDNNIASVESGLVTAIAKGITTIIATTEDGNHTAECEVIVTDETGLESISGESSYRVQKVLEDGTIYIIRNGERYMVDGRKVE